MAEALIVGLRKKKLIGGMVGMDCLQSVLNSMCDLINSHEAEIQHIKNELTERITVSEFEAAIKQKDNEIAELATKFNDYVEENQKMLNSIILNHDTFKQEANDAIDGIKNNFESEMKQISDQIASNNMIQTTAMNKINSSILNLQHFQGSINNEISEIKDTLNQVGLSSISILNERLEKLDDQFVTLSHAISSTQDNMGTFSDSIGVEISKLKSQVNQELHGVSRQLEEIQTQFMADPKFGAPVNLDDVTESDLTPLVLTVHRDSRRLDGVDKQISSVRIECENVSSSMEAVHRTMQQFNHQIYDFQLQLDQTRNEILGRFQNIEPFVKWVGGNVRDLWAASSQVGAAASHIASSTSKSLEDLYNLVNSMSSRPMPQINSLDEVIIESSNVQDNLHEKRMNVDFEKQMVGLRPVFKKRWKTNIPLEGPKEVPSFKPTITPFRPSALVEMSGVGNGGGGFTMRKEDPMLMMTLEEMRVKMNKFEQKLPKFTSEVQEYLKQTGALVDTKMDSSEADRLFEKVHRSIHRLQRTIDGVQAELAASQVQQPTQTSAQGTARTAAPKGPPAIPADVAADALTARLFSGRRNEALSGGLFKPPVKRPKTSIPIKLSGHAGSPSRLASDKVGEPYNG